MTSLRHFFIIGAQRSGTTYLYKILDSHPAIEMAKPLKPEPKFFLQDNLDFYTVEDYVKRYFSSDHNVMWYGEKSTTYIESEVVAERIKSWFPDAMILVMLRHPIDRAISNYFFTKKHGLEPLSLEEAFRQEEQRRDDYDQDKISASPYAYLQRGHYINYLRNWEKFFARERIMVRILEEFVENLDAIQQLYTTLGVDSTHVPEDLTRTINENPHEIVKLPVELKHYLKVHFAESNLALEEWLGRPIPRWRNRS